MKTRSEKNLDNIIKGCKKGLRNSQKTLYEDFFGYAMSICLRYASNEDLAIEICNDGFMKIFQKINKYDPKKSFKGWVRKIMINTSIDHYRKNKKFNQSFGVDYIQDIPDIDVETKEDIISKISYEEIIKLVQKLSPTYKTVFNLYVIDGFTHEEIAKRLKISVGASKSNLSRARENLRRMLQNTFNRDHAKYTG